MFHLASTPQLSSMPVLVLLVSMVIPSVMSFPWVAGIPGIKSPAEVEAQHAKRQTTCPFNPNHVPAAPISAQFPYAGAINGLPATRPGNFQVPAFGDTVHGFTPPGPNDIRGPCPGLNTAANHNVCTLETDRLVDMCFANALNSSSAMTVSLLSVSSSMRNRTFTTSATTLRSY